MSIICTSNFCGKAIAANAPYVTLNGNGDRSQEFWKTGYIGHDHADPAVGCWDRILAEVRLHDAPQLDTIPTASHLAISARRRKHRPMESEDGAAPAA